MVSERPLSIDAYVREKQISLSRSIVNRKKIYLDLNFWIIARDAEAGVRVDAPACELLRLLREGVSNGRIICPVGDNVFMELMKQRNTEDRRIGTARLVDELSLGISLISFFMRIKAETTSFLYRYSGLGKDQHQMQELVWTKVCYVLGNLYPVLPKVDAMTMFSLQKDFIDYLWEISLTEMLHWLGDQPGPVDPYKELGVETNRQRDQHAHEITSFARAYEIESAGAIDGISHIIADVFDTMAEQNGVMRSDRSSPAWKATENMYKNLFREALKKLEVRRRMPTLHVETSLHAAVRVDKQRRFKSNDFYDFHHASAALGYCDYFFTEAPLSELITRKQLGLQAVSDCIVVSYLEEARDVLREMLYG